MRDFSSRSGTCGSTVGGRVRKGRLIEAHRRTHVWRSVVRACWGALLLLVVRRKARQAAPLRKNRQLRRQPPRPLPLQAALKSIRFNQLESEVPFHTSVLRRLLPSTGLRPWVFQSFRTVWWSRWNSNPRPPRCHRGALPTAPRPHRWKKAGTFISSRFAAGQTCGAGCCGFVSESDSSVQLFWESCIGEPALKRMVSRWRSFPER